MTCSHKVCLGRGLEERGNAKLVLDCIEIKHTQIPIKKQHTCIILTTTSVYSADKAAISVHPNSCMFNCLKSPSHIQL